MASVGSQKSRSSTKAKAQKKGASSKGKENKAISLSNVKLQLKRVFKQRRELCRR